MLELAEKRVGGVHAASGVVELRDVGHAENGTCRDDPQFHQLTDVMEGKLGSLVDALVSHYEAERLEQELAGA